MGFLKLFVVGSLLFAGLAFLVYEPVADGIEQKWKAQAFLGGLRTMRYIATFSSYFGWLEGATLRNLLETVASLNPENPDINVTLNDFDGVPVYLYKPKSVVTPSRGIVYYHGGGFVIGGKESYNQLVERIANDLNAIVVFVELAPEHPFPTSIEDCVKASVYFINHAEEFGVDPTKLALMGDSAGGNAAAVVSIKLRSILKDHQPQLQVLIYPLTQWVSMHTPSYQANEDGPFLSKSFMAMFTSSYMFGKDYKEYKPTVLSNNYSTAIVRKSLFKTYMDISALPKDDLLKGFSLDDDKSNNVQVWEKVGAKMMDIKASPLFEKDLNGLPHAYITTCQHDVLRDDGFFYAKRLKDSGVKVHHVNLENCFHGWIVMSKIGHKQFNDQFTEILNYIDNNL